MPLAGGACGRQRRSRLRRGMQAITARTAGTHAVQAWGICLAAQGTFDCSTVAGPPRLVRAALPLLRLQALPRRPALTTRRAHLEHSLSCGGGSSSAGHRGAAAGGTRGQGRHRRACRRQPCQRAACGRAAARHGACLAAGQRLGWLASLERHRYVFAGRTRREVPGECRAGWAGRRLRLTALDTAMLSRCAPQKRAGSGWGASVQCVQYRCRRGIGGVCWQAAAVLLDRVSCAAGLCSRAAAEQARGHGCLFSMRA